jgi:hypothetical protein
VIRQAISCDICGAEKQQTNKWFVVYDQGGELRVSGWNSRNRLRPGSKHLCGQICLHKLVDEFMARTLAARTPAAAAEESETTDLVAGTDASLTSDAAYAEVESSARLIKTPLPIAAKRATPATPVELVAVPLRPRAAEPAEILSTGSAEISPLEPIVPPARDRRAEAWQRERERELRSVGHRPDATGRRRSNS